jgi:hypothetical protein
MMEPEKVVGRNTVGNAIVTFDTRLRSSSRIENVKSVSFFWCAQNEGECVMCVLCVWVMLVICVCGWRMLYILYSWCNICRP